MSEDIKMVEASPSQANMSSAELAAEVPFNRERLAFRSTTPSGEDAEELQGNLVVQGTPTLSGGYTDIFRGMWRSTDGTLTDVAVKILKSIGPTSLSCRPDLIALQQRREERLRREVAVRARLIHPNIQPLLGFRTQPEPCLVSQWSENGNLANYLDNNPNLSRPAKLQLVVQAARGLAFLHSQSPTICHANIKPENVLVNELCEAALSGFGLSRVIRELDASTGFTTEDEDELKGSQKYMAPELFTEENSKPTLETDVYAFGGLTLAVMSGSPPFARINSPAKVLLRVVSEIHPKPEEHPDLEENDPLWSIMRRCWAREPQMRPTISDVVVELRELKRPVDMNYEVDSFLLQSPAQESRSPGQKYTSADRHPAYQPTQCECGKNRTHYPEQVWETAFPGKPEKIYNLIFESGFMRDFLAKDQKLMSLQISDWYPKSKGSQLLARSMSYIKHLDGSVNPRQTKCELKEETVHVDFDSYVSTVTTTKTPDVPSGHMFLCKTRTCLMWAGPASTKIIVTTRVEWSGHSFVESIIERGAAVGQRKYYSDLERAMRKYISEHPTEFIPEGAPSRIQAVSNLDAAFVSLRKALGDKSQQRKSSLGVESSAYTPSPHPYPPLFVPDSGPDEEEEDLAVSLRSDSRQAPALRGYEERQHRSSLKAGSSAHPPSPHPHSPLRVIDSDPDSEKEDLAVSLHSGSHQAPTLRRDNFDLDFFIDSKFPQFHPHPFPTSDLTFNITPQLHVSSFLPYPFLDLPTGPLAQPAPQSPTAHSPLLVAPRDPISVANVPQPPSRQVKIPPEKGRKTYPCTWPGCTLVARKRNTLIQVGEASHHLD